MKHRKREDLKALEEQFLKALTEKTPDFEKAKELLGEGVDINAVDSYGESILGDLLLTLSSFPPECDSCELDSCKTCEIKRSSKLISIIEFFINNGWDTVAYGLHLIASLVHTTHDAKMFYAAKRILECPLSEDREAFEHALESIGSEESYQRCCEECHDQENLYYAMYEIGDAKMNGKPFAGIHPYYRALGKKIDRIVYFAEKNDFAETSRGIEFNHDLGFVCGDELVVVTSGMNILLMNDRLSEKPQTDVTTFFEDGIVGATITDVSFEHKTINRANSRYGQPTIIVKLDNGKEIGFTHNFGELPDKKTQARFSTSEASMKFSGYRDCLFDMCASTSIDLDKIEAFIIGTNLSSDDITQTAIKLVEAFAWEIGAFKAANRREPEENELVTSNWLDLFKLFLKYGLDANAVYCKDGFDHDNLLHFLTWLDNTSIIYKLFRLLLENGADPNVMIDDESLFEKIDGHVVMDATLMEIEGEDRAPYETFFRLWLLLLAYGGELSTGKDALKMNDDYCIDMFENCECFSYRKEVTEDDWYLHIYITKTGEEVAVL